MEGTAVFLATIYRVDNFLKRDFYERIMFGWLTATRYNFPGISLDKAIDQFYSYFNLNDTFMKKKSARRVYSRMLIEFQESNKNGQKNNTSPGMGNDTKDSQ